MAWIEPDFDRKHFLPPEPQSDIPCEECKHFDKDLDKPPCDKCWNSENRDAFRPRKVDDETDDTDSEDMYEEDCPLCGC